MTRKVAILVILLTFSFIDLLVGDLNVPKKILFIGNSWTSYNEGLDVNIKTLASSAKPRLAIEGNKVTMGGATTEMLWNYDKVHEVLDSSDYDVVVLQINISLAKKDSLYMNQTDIKDEIQLNVTKIEYLKKFVAKIDAAGAETVLWTVWQTPDKRLWDWITIKENAHAHQEIISELDLKVAPTGLALQRAAEERPDLEFIGTDKRHPTLHATYLFTCVLYTTIYNRSPIGSSYLPSIDYPATEVTEEVAAFLQHIAWETVQEYQSQ